MATLMDSLMETMGEHFRSDAPEYIMSLDAGTTSVRAIIFDSKGKKIAQAQRPLTMIYPQPGWVEQDPVEILSSQIACMIEVQLKSGIHSDSIQAIGITNQRETVVMWDRTTGKPIYNAIVWQCRRTTPEVDRLKEEGYADMIRQKTGLVLDAYFSATKIKWVLDNVEGARELADNGNLMCGTVDTWLVYNLTHGQVHATDYTNASRTMLFNINTLDWDDELLAMLDIPRSILPEAKPSAADYGYVMPELMTCHPAIAGVAGDQQASLFGHGCFEPGDVKNTYGTGCFMLMNLGDKPTLSDTGLITTIGIADGTDVHYALEGSVFQAGSVMQWLRDELQIIDDVSESAELAMSVDDTDGCYIVPAFTGLGAPWWEADARGLICGITRGTNKPRLVRAACESMAYQTYDVLKAMEVASGHKLKALGVDGGGSRNEFTMQFQSDLLDIKVERAEVDETTALGAAYLAGLATGFWKDKNELREMRAVSDSYAPHMDRDRAEELIVGWHRAVSRTID